MRLTEIIQTNLSTELSEVCHFAKSLYNLANWYIRQDFFKLNNFLSYYDLDFVLKRKNAYRNLPSQTSQQILKLVVRNWKSLFRALKDWNVNKKKYKRNPKIPKYKKKNGEASVIFTNQQCKIKDGWLYFPKRINLEPIKTRIKEKLKEVRIIPLGRHYKIEIIYEREEQDLKLNKEHILSIDLGLNNLITAVNNNGCRPFIIKGGMIKSINQYYNKQLAYFRSIENKKG
ncbi:MAG: RNA-guided endonuclease InsQ/TnpB family protein, partial [Promethearchaeota archaeon]